MPCRWTSSSLCRSALLPTLWV
ncbi:hypothetical protein CGCA056_v006484 [Colletotrichum aenigma]|nr:hypothetical protein CGCSCA1_v001310 [Colletotrichum siamense]KAF5521766.1 hypothetical protein CGCA056_v006484 [Colletotrichum aenigma]